MRSNCTVMKGDWEMCQIAFRVKKDEFVVIEPFAMTASQHYYGETRKWKDVEKDPVSQERLVLYVARDTHATYFEAGRFWTDSGHKARGPDECNFPVFDYCEKGIRIDVKEDQLEKLKTEALLWHGYWGEPYIHYMPHPPWSEVLYKASGPLSPGFRASGKVCIWTHAADFHNKFVKDADKKELLIKPVNEDIIDP